jgi:hypothetical protein
LQIRVARRYRFGSWEAAMRTLGMVLWITVLSACDGGNPGDTDPGGDTTGGTGPAVEVCDDGVDNDLDGAEDCSDTECAATCDADQDGELGLAFGGTDCDDTDAAINTTAVEVCDDADNDCDGLTDVDDDSLDLSTATPQWLDGDADGYGGVEAPTACSLLPGNVTDSTDCDDTDSGVNPGATEVCDGVDQNCNIQIDEGLPKTGWFPDVDLDGFGDSGAGVQACAQPPGMVTDFHDCDDSDASVNPNATEVCDGADNNCNGFTDDADPTLDPIGAIDFWVDNDSDGFGDPGRPFSACSNPDPAKNAENGEDCDDTDGAVFPGAIEMCNGWDDDCDTFVDQADPGFDLANLTLWYIDDDHDGLGQEGTEIADCVGPPGYVNVGGDCDDADPNSGGAVDWYFDLDADGVGGGAPVAGSPACAMPAPGALPATDGVDCNDADPAINPGAAEICGDGIDQDCSGGDLSCGPTAKFVIDDGPAWMTNPPTFNCLEACALLYGGVATDWSCSTSSVVIDHMSFVDGWGDSQYCITPVAETFKKAANYDCGAATCSYSAYVMDHSCMSINWCWAN